MSTELLLLDLDHTLFDPETIPRSVMEPVFQAVRDANRRWGGVAEDVLERSLVEIMRAPITGVAKRYGWPERLRSVCLETSAGVTLPDVLPAYPDVPALVRLPQRKILVTTGVPGLQLGKVRALGFGSWLDGIRVDDVLAVPRQGKGAVFQEVLAEEGTRREAVVVVGDRLESEIAAGAALGLRTVHVARGHCPGGCAATHCIEDLTGLEGLL